MRFRLSAWQVLVVTSNLVLTGCLLGPDFHKPVAPKTIHYTETPQPVKTITISKAGQAGIQQNFKKGRDIPALWWHLFHSPQINELIKIGLQNSPNLAAAKATLVQAEENLNAQIGADFYPNVTAQFTPQRQRFNTASFGSATGVGSSIFNLYNASINVSYTLDVFGALRRQVEGYSAQVDYEEYELAAAYLTLTSNIVTTAFTIASYEAQIAATNYIITALRNEYNIMQKQLKLGGVSGNDVLSQEAQLTQTEGTLPPLRQRLAESRHALAVLIGVLPSDLRLGRISLDKLYLPANLPVTMPSVFVRQRPDILASEALLHVANAQVGVTTANLFPQITISGNYGYASGIPSGLFKNASSVWAIGGTLLQPVFNGGELRAEQRAAIAGYHVAAAQYRQTVLSAFQNVADALRALQHDAQALRALKQAELASQKSLDISTQQYHLGGVTYLVLLTAEKQYQQALIARVQTQALRYNDTAALFQALGGGWWNQKNILLDYPMA
jgi:NodT family efflux transporter outer membrane factor (OMF) lipoprotein